MLVSTLLACLMIAGLLLVLQAQSLAITRGSRRLTRAYAEALDHAALYELLRADVARAILAASDPEIRDADAPKLDSTPFTLRYRGHGWQIALQDVQGLVDVYSTPDEIWRRLGVDPLQLAARRAQALEGWPEGARLPTLEASMAAFGLSKELKPWLTQDARGGGPNLLTTPTEVRRKIGGQIQATAQDGFMRVISVHIRAAFQR